MAAKRGHSSLTAAAVLFSQVIVQFIPLHSNERTKSRCYLLRSLSYTTTEKENMIFGKINLLQVIYWQTYNLEWVKSCYKRGIHSHIWAVVGHNHCIVVHFHRFILQWCATRGQDKWCNKVLVCYKHRPACLHPLFLKFFGLTAFPVFTPQLPFFLWSELIKSRGHIYLFTLLFIYFKYRLITKAQEAVTTYIVITSSSRSLQDWIKYCRQYNKAHFFTAVIIFSKKHSFYRLREIVLFIYLLLMEL